MGIFDKNFWIETGDENKTAVEQAVDNAKQKVTPQSKPAAPVAAPVQTYSYNPSTSSTGLSPEVKAHFLQLIKGKNLPGPDFYEFSQSLIALAAVPDEGMRYKAAYDVLSSTAGLTLDKLKSSIKFYQQLVQTSLNEFGKTFDAEFQKQVTGPRNSINDKRNQLEQLKQQIENLTNEIALTDNRANEAEAALNVQKAKFLEGGQAFIEDLGAEDAKINRYIS